MKSSRKVKCSHEDIALKSFFIGPQSENAEWTQREINRILKKYFSWRRHLFHKDGRVISAHDQQDKLFKKRQADLAQKLHRLSDRFEGETPKHTPRYVAHMVSEVSLPALLGHFLTLLHNPNNIGKEVAKVGLEMEAEAIDDLATLVGYKKGVAQGHFTSGGTVANIEGLWRARFRFDHWLSLGSYLRNYNKSRESLFELAHMGWDQFKKTIQKHQIADEALKSYSLVASQPWVAFRHLEAGFGHQFNGAVILVPGHKHYSWMKAVSLLGFGEEAFWSVELDRFGHMKPSDLSLKIDRARKANRPVAMVVSVAGTTELGDVDSVHEIQNTLDDLKKNQGIHIWNHIDAAYGGFFCSTLKDPVSQKILSERTLQAFQALHRAESITLDPHKLGYVPYSCGAILVKDESCNGVSQFAAAYLDQTKERQIWTTTLEGSRPAMGATAVWLSSQSLGFNEKGLGVILRKCLEARVALTQLILEQLPEVKIIDAQDTNIFCFSVARSGQKSSVANKLTEKLFDRIVKSPEFSVSRTILHVNQYGELIRHNAANWSLELDSDRLFLIRIVLMNPFSTSKVSKFDYLQGFVTFLKREIKRIAK
ncbi:MAG: decarboxylase [Oligoflexia bacterium]|nr:decarboxylase [Oligoflexia bacterium]